MVIADHDRVGLSTAADPATWGDLPAGLERARQFGSAAVELAALFEEGLDALLDLAEAGSLELGAFGYVSAHAPAERRTRTWEELARSLERLPARIETIVVHPSRSLDPAPLRTLGARVALESMDVTKHCGRTVQELRPFFDALPEASYCLDVAHAWTVDPSLAAGHHLLDAFGERLRQVHLSGIEPDGTHRPTTQADLDLYAPLLERCRDVPWILETLLA